MILQDLTFWQNLGAFGLGFVLWLAFIIVLGIAGSIGTVVISKWNVVDKILGWLLFAVLLVVVVGIFWITGLKVLYGI